MKEFQDQRCEPCHRDSPCATREEIESFRTQNPGWQIVLEGDAPRVQRQYSFPDFEAALAFANRIGALAETENHHPLLTIEWGKVLVAWWTHSIHNIHRNDLIMAAKTDAVFEN